MPASNLLERYGTWAVQVHAYASTSNDKPLSSLPQYSTGEIAYICQHEKVRRLADLLLRRTAITMEGLLTDAAIEETAPVAARILGWDSGRTAAEIALARAEMESRSVGSVRPA